MGKRIGPEARIIALFLALPEDSRRIVLDVIKSQTRPKSTASGASERSSRRSSKATSTPNTEARQVSAIAASGD